jgi:outer membrane cobalamin receptor
VQVVVRDEGVLADATQPAAIEIERGGARVFLMVVNLLDRQYEVTSGYPMPGLALTCSLQLRL